MQVLLLILSITIVTLFALLIMASLRSKNQKKHHKENYHMMNSNMMNSQKSSGCSNGGCMATHQNPGYMTTTNLYEGGRFVHKSMPYDGARQVLRNNILHM